MAHNFRDFFSCVVKGKFGPHFFHKKIHRLWINLWIILGYIRSI